KTGSATESRTPPGARTRPQILLRRLIFFLSALRRGRRSFRLPLGPARLAGLGEPGRTQREASADSFASRPDLGSPPRLFRHPTSIGGWRLQRIGPPLAPAPASLPVHPLPDRSPLTPSVYDDSEARAVGASPSN